MCNLYTAKKIDQLGILNSFETILDFFNSLFRYHISKENWMKKLVEY